MGRGGEGGREGVEWEEGGRQGVEWERGVVRG